jgi:hypothetical protein
LFSHRVAAFGLSFAVNRLNVTPTGNEDIGDDEIESSLVEPVTDESLPLLADADGDAAVDPAPLPTLTALGLSLLRLKLGILLRRGDDALRRGDAGGVLGSCVWDIGDKLGGGGGGIMCFDPRLLLSSSKLWLSDGRRRVGGGTLSAVDGRR